jgi:hypothetical protein
MERALLIKAIRPATMDWPNAPRIGFLRMEKTGPRDHGMCFWGERIQIVEQRLQAAIEASA